MSEELHDSTYTGPRFRYGRNSSPALPDNRILDSCRPHKQFLYGTVDYAFELSPEQEAQYDLKLNQHIHYSGDPCAPEPKADEAVAPSTQSPTRDELVARARQNRAEIEQYFHETQHWNDKVRLPWQRRIDPDPDGLLNKILQALDSFLAVKHENE